MTEKFSQDFPLFFLSVLLFSLLALSIPNKFAMPHDLCATIHLRNTAPRSSPLILSHKALIVSFKLQYRSTAAQQHFLPLSFELLYSLNCPVSTHSFLRTDQKSSASPFITYSYGSHP